MEIHKDLLLRQLQHQLTWVASGLEKLINHFQGNYLLKEGHSLQDWKNEYSRATEFRLYDESLYKASINQLSIKIKYLEEICKVQTEEIMRLNKKLNSDEYQGMC